MNKYEIETAIIEELKSFMPSIKNVPFDKGLPLMQREAWRLADKYDTAVDEKPVNGGSYNKD